MVVGQVFQINVVAHPLAVLPVKTAEQFLMVAEGKQLVEPVLVPAQDKHAEAEAQVFLMSAGVQTTALLVRERTVAVLSITVV